MSTNYQHLGVYSDWVEAAQRQQPLFPKAAPGAATQTRVREVLGFNRAAEIPLAAQIERRWQSDDLIGEEVSWSVGYGPRTHAYVIKPVRAKEPLPALVALHDHSDFKFYGKEKIADGPAGIAAGVQALRDIEYGSRSYVAALAREGFVVIAHDAFLWGSRCFPLETMIAAVGDQPIEPSPFTDAAPEIEHYNTIAALHEHRVAKYCNALGTSLAGVVAYEDRIALNYLLSRSDVIADRVGCLGLSGGGNRAALLTATHDRIAATVIVGLMTTYEGLLDHNMSHTWMLFPFGWSRYGDWPDLAACRAPSPLLVQYDLEDDLFTEAGMRAADARLAAHYASVGQPENYVGQFYPGPHKFDLEMQAAAFDWLKQQLR
ncbi:MAG: acyl-CoA thioester hydrolase/BAAT C-terminal domain-containing protein [Anaerolineae bacterium]